MYDRLSCLLFGTRALNLGKAKNDRLIRWIGLVVLVIIAALTRLVLLNQPEKLVFDEIYYVRDSYSLLQFGYEVTWPDYEGVILDTNSYYERANFVVHPQVSKWLIALGLRFGGGPENPASWRLPNAILGIIAVILVFFIGRKLFSSTGAGLIAGLFMAIDGVAITHSRTALLDQSLMFFVLIAFGCLLMDREQSRKRLITKICSIEGNFSLYKPGLGFRWWRLAAGVSLGLAIGSKWLGLYFLAGFGLMTVLWDFTARRAVQKETGIGKWQRDGFIFDGIPAFLTMVPTALVVYVASWWSWFKTPDAYLRQWAAQNPGQGITWLPEALRSLVEYHSQIFNFHRTFHSSHPYATNPLGFIIQFRSTCFYWENLEGWFSYPLVGGHSGHFIRVIYCLGNPLIWWLAAASIIVVILSSILKRDWRALPVLSGTIFGWLPWLAYMERQNFFFYSIVFTPWIIFTLVYAGVIAFEYSENIQKWRKPILITIGCIVVLICIISVWFYPIWTAMPTTLEYWRKLMWLPSWV